MPFVLNKTTVLASLAIAASTATATTAPWGNCKNDITCTDGYYCQPWDAAFYQCFQTLPKCPQQLTNVDFPGDDIKEANVNQPGECCDACANTPDCTHYTYDNNRNGSPGCYLKKNGPGKQASKAGVVSGIMSSQPVTPTPSSPTPVTPTPSTSTPSYKGNWLQVNGIDFTKQDISSVANVADINGCKQHCDQTQGCQSVSYAHNTCYLKFTAINYSLDINVNALIRVAKADECVASSDFEGHDVTNYEADFDQCSADCRGRKDCNAFVWVQSTWSPKGICYMKSIAAGQNPVANSRGSIACKTGVSPVTPVPSSSTPTVSPTPTPSSQCTAGWGDCTQSKCCSTSGQYCQPWSPAFYGCITAPAECKTQLTNIDLTGNDLKMVAASQPGDCCKACTETPGCKAYTYDNFRDGTPGCYLKSSADGSRVSKAGVVSGIL